MRLTELDRHRLRYLAIALSGFVLFPIGWRLETLIGGRAVVIVFLIAAVAWCTAVCVFCHRSFFSVALRATRSSTTCIQPGSITWRAIPFRINVRSAAMSFRRRDLA